MGHFEPTGSFCRTFTIKFAAVKKTDGDTGYFDIVTGILQRDTVALFLFVICLNYVQGMSIDLMRGHLPRAMTNRDG